MFFFLRILIKMRCKIKEVKNNDIKEEKELNNNKDFEDILELVNLLS